jgi:ubiquinone/menaquinone biosynthesis C-methylase UbiE
MLVQQWLPLVPQTTGKLRAGARVADVGCGTG